MDVDQNAPTRVEELWFSDGGLVVQAENSLYRVSGGILAARSSVFKDMLSFPQPPDAVTVEGCPVVQLPDSAGDVTCFFRAIFDSSFFETYPIKTSLDIVISILHLSNKYAIEYLRRRALVHLSSAFPTTLAEYDNLATASFKVGDDIDSLSFHVAAVQISREVNALWALPAAFYALTQADDAGISIVLNCRSYKNHSAKLSGDDQILFLKGSFKLIRSANRLFDAVHSLENVTGCASSRRCPAARLRGLVDVRNHLNSDDGDDPLYMISASEIWNPLYASCCTACYNSLKDRHRAARRELWDKLPSFCDLPPWEELEKMKAEAQG
ncbi:hypothetical protein C8R43DRAFT_1238198 [Mycena crocata]|nr:hypothetical protein C8R43DRAFT_1238198 [Mycena crocata]